MSTISKAMNCDIDGLRTFKITNIVANACVGFPINISALQHERYVIRNDKFPGIVYKGFQQMVKSVLVFASGKLVFTGAKSKDDIDQAFIDMKRLL